MNLLYKIILKKSAERIRYDVEGGLPDESEFIDNKSSDEYFIGAHIHQHRDFLMKNPLALSIE